MAYGYRNADHFKTAILFHCGGLNLHPASPTGEDVARVRHHQGAQPARHGPPPRLCKQARALRVALLGPSHFAPLRGIAVSGADGWLTPLGTVPVDGGLRTTAVSAGAVVDDMPHARDHALEVQLPFLQQRAGEELSVLPAAVGGPEDETAAVVEALSPEALIVVSTDLSHFHDYATARRLDRRTADAVVALDVTAIRDSDACGADALRALLVHAQRAGWRCVELELPHLGRRRRGQRARRRLRRLRAHRFVGCPARATRAAVRARRRGSGVRSECAQARTTSTAVSGPVRQAAWTASGRLPARVRTQ
jgi:hypothetical protein